MFCQKREDYRLGLEHLARISSTSLEVAQTRLQNERNFPGRSIDFSAFGDIARQKNDFMFVLVASLFSKEQERWRQEERLAAARASLCKTLEEHAQTILLCPFRDCGDLDWTHDTATPCRART